MAFVDYSDDGISSVICWLQTVPGRPVIPNLAGLTLQQRQALLAQQRFMVSSDARRMLVRPPSSGIILPPGRVLLTSNGPASLIPGVSGRPAGVAAVTTSSGVLLTMAPSATAHRPEKRKYDALRYDCHVIMVRLSVFAVCANKLICIDELEL